jgi:hypothetical protein
VADSRSSGEAPGVTIQEDSVIGVRLERALLSDRTKLHDVVGAHVTRDVLVDGRMALAAGTRVEGTIVGVERVGTGGDRARLEILFHTIVFSSDKRVPIQTDPIVRTSPAPSAASSSFAAGAALGRAVTRGGQPVAGARVGVLPPQPPPGRGADSPPPVAVRAAVPTDVNLPAGSLLTLKLTAPLRIER